MRVFNEEAVKGIAEVVVILKPKEAQTIIEAVEYAYDKRPLKKTWKKLLDDLEKAGVY